MSGPFHAFAQSIQRQSPLRAAITAAYRRPEPECVPPLLDAARLPAGAAPTAARALARAAGRRRCARKTRGASGLSRA